MLRLRASWASTSIRCVYGEIAGQANKRPRTPRWIKEPVSLVQRLQDAPRPGAVPKFTVEQRAQMAAVACEAPAKTGRPISQWTGREIADELKQRGIVPQISPRHAARLLKKGASNRTGFAIG